MTDQNLLPVPVVLLASTEAGERDAAVLQALLELPGLVVLTHDMTEDADGDLRVRRTIADAGGTRSDVTVDLDHPCLGCLAREDLVPALAELHDDALAVLVVLPLGADLQPAARTIEQHLHAELAGYRPAGVVMVARDEAVVAGLAGGDEDLLLHLVSADVLVLSDGGQEPVRQATLDLVEALRGPGSAVVPDLGGAWLEAALTRSLDAEALAHRSDPATAGTHHDLDPAARTGKQVNVHTPHMRFATATMDVTRSGVWRLVLATDRPLHPGRLLRSARALAPEHTVSRGRFVVANRPDSPCGWQGVGGTLRIGPANGHAGVAAGGAAGVGAVGEDDVGTRIVVVGRGGNPVNAVAAFERMIVTEEEHLPPAGWADAPDPLTPFLGPVGARGAGEAA
ncbi:GTP-binding protein [Georgenia sp. Z1491]|uniref:GTP-binding protein n=1 Tax=Georgenia sp. Z1491 TaxID=3416707 RepID=UPI003CE71111